MYLSQKKNQIMINNLINCIISVDHSDKTMIQLHHYFFATNESKEEKYYNLNTWEIKMNIFTDWYKITTCM